MWEKEPNRSIINESITERDGRAKEARNEWVFNEYYRIALCVERCTKVNIIAIKTTNINWLNFRLVENPLIIIFAILERFCTRRWHASNETNLSIEYDVFLLMLRPPLIPLALSPTFEPIMGEMEFNKTSCSSLYPLVPVVLSFFLLLPLLLLPRKNEQSTNKKQIGLLLLLF